MIAKDKSFSILTIKFFSNLFRALEEQQIKVEDIFRKKVYLQKEHEISHGEFIKVMEFSKTKSSVMDAYEIYKELREAENLSVSCFINNYKIFQSKIEKLPRPKTRQRSISKEKQQMLEKELIKSALSKLEKFIQQKGISIFDEFAEGGVLYLTVKDFNKMLISTEIQELRSEYVRKQIIKRLYHYYPAKVISRTEFWKLFKLQEENKPKNKSPITKPITPPKIRIVEKKNSDNVNFISNPPPDFKKQNGNKSLNVPVNLPIKVPINEINKKVDQENLESQSNDEIFDFKKKFPLASAFYRLGVPETYELKYMEELENLLQKHQFYIDKSNPETHKGVYTYAKDIFLGHHYEIFMMAASVIFREKSRIGLGREIEPKDIVQGELGDCYFLSSIASIISFYPEVIFQKFLFSVSDARYYVVKLFIDGEWKMIRTDDQFPTNKGKAVFAKPHGYEIWVMLLEKCYAKQFGSYVAIESGTPTEAYRALTGAPSEYINIEKEEDHKMIKEKLEMAFHNKYVTTISGSKYLESLPEKKQEELGLIPNHAYSFLKFIKIEGELVARIMNPWGKTKWKGDWSFGSAKWTPELRKKYNYEYEQDDGIFYIPWGSLIKYFSSFAICKVEPTFIHSSHKLKVKPHKSSYFQVEIPENGIYSFSVYHESKRKHAKTPNYEYSPIRLIVLKDNNGEYEYISSINKNLSHSVTVQNELEKGRYLIAVKVEWGNQIPREVVFCSYGVETVKFENIENFIAPIFKKSLILSYSQKFRGTKKTYSKINIDEAYNEIEISIERGIGYLKVKNPTNKAFSSTYSMSECKGLKAIKPNKLPFTCEMLPNKEIVIGFWVSSEGYSFKSEETIRTK